MFIYKCINLSCPFMLILRLKSHSIILEGDFGGKYVRAGSINLKLPVPVGAEWLSGSSRCSAP